MSNSNLYDIHNILSKDVILEIIKYLDITTAYTFIISIKKMIDNNQLPLKSDTFDDVIFYLEQVLDSINNFKNSMNIQKMLDSEVADKYVIIVDPNDNLLSHIRETNYRVPYDKLKDMLPHTKRSKNTLSNNDSLDDSLFNDSILNNSLLDDSIFNNSLLERVYLFGVSGRNNMSMTKFIFSQKYLFEKCHIFYTPTTLRIVVPHSVYEFYKKFQHKMVLSHSSAINRINDYNLEHQYHLPVYRCNSYALCVECNTTSPNYGKIILYSLYLLNETNVVIDDYDFYLSDLLYFNPKFDTYYHLRFVMRSLYN